MISPDPAACAALSRHVEALRACRRCPGMASTPVSGGPTLSRVLLLGQAPGRHEPRLGRPFAWTAGRTLFAWFAEHCGIGEADFRAQVYLAAVCRCFPGPTAAGGDRVPDSQEVARCAPWLEAEFRLLAPWLVIPVGRLAISRFLPGTAALTEIIGRQFTLRRDGHAFDLVPLPHPSGASPWPRVEPGKTLLRQALALLRAHPAFPAGGNAVPPLRRPGQSR